MRLLKNCLADEPLPRLTAIADAWDIRFEAASAREMIEMLAEEMLAGGAAAAGLDALPAETRIALAALVNNNGRMPAAAYERRFGVLRPMGPGRLERERPWLSPANTTEMLWYRGFIFRGFDRTLPNPTEVVFVPTDLLAKLLEIGDWRLENGDGRVQSPISNLPSPISSTGLGELLLDDLTTLLSQVQNTDVRLQADGAWSPQARLAAQPMLRDDHGLRSAEPGGRFAFLCRMIDRMGWLKSVRPLLRLTPQPVIDWLKAPIPTQLGALFEAWRSDPQWNDLACVEGIAFEMEHAWNNAPLQERAAVLRLLSDWLASRGAAITVEDFTDYVSITAPDFARPDGRYDTWHIRDTETGEFLHGFQHWRRVEGGLIRRLLEGPLHWLGLLQVEDGRVLLTEFGQAALSSQPAPAPAPGREAGADATEPLGGLRSGSEAAVRVLRAARFQRFQLSRIADWAGTNDEDYLYRLSPSSLARARTQGINPPRVMEFLQQYSDAPVPPNLLKGIRQWGEQGAEVRLEPAHLIRAKDAATLEALLALPAVRSAVIERLSPTCATIRPRDIGPVAAEITRSGLLVELP